MTRSTVLRACLPLVASLAFSVALAETRNAYFGDLHIHTRYSYDSFFFGTVASPDDAYEFAKGKPLATSRPPPSGTTIRARSRPSSASSSRRRRTWTGSTGW